MVIKWKLHKYSYTFQRSGLETQNNHLNCTIEPVTFTMVSRIIVFCDPGTFKASAQYATHCPPLRSSCITEVLPTDALIRVVPMIIIIDTHAKWLRELSSLWIMHSGVLWKYLIFWRHSRKPITDVLLIFRYD